MVDDEIQLLRAAGVVVVAHLPSSDEIDDTMPLRERLALAGAPVYFRPGVRAVERLIVQERPDVVHVHNPYPLISPWIVRSAHSARVPVVHSVHNYRVACMKGTFFRDGHVCEDCASRTVKWPGALHGCYRKSRPQSVAMAIGLTTHRRTWRSVERHLVLSDWMRDKLRAEGIPNDRIVLKRNPVAGPPVAPPAGKGFLFAGRLDDEKGIDLLLDAWDLSASSQSLTLTIVGDGPMRSLVETRAAASRSLRFLGQVSGAEVAHQIKAAAAVVVPSRCYEGLPRVLAEAFAQGRPVVTTAAPLASIVMGAGALASPAAPALAAAIDAIAPREKLARLGRAARSRWEREFRPEAVVAQVLDSYRAVRGTSG